VNRSSTKICASGGAPSITSAGGTTTVPRFSAPSGFAPGAASAGLVSLARGWKARGDEDEDAAGDETSAGERSGVLRLCDSPVSGATVPLDIVGASAGLAGLGAGGLVVAEGAFIGL